MNKEEKEAIEKIKILSIGDFITWFTADGCIEMEIAAKTILNLIQKQEKIIDKMAEELYFDCWDRVCQECCKECEKDIDTQSNCIKEYFKKVVDEQ